MTDVIALADDVLATAATFQADDQGKFAARLLAGLPLLKASAAPARVEPIIAMAAVGAARRAGVPYQPGQKIDAVVLNAALDKRALDPLTRIVIKNQLYAAGALDD